MTIKSHDGFCKAFRILTLVKTQELREESETCQKEKYMVDLREIVRA